MIRPLLLPLALAVSASPAVAGCFGFGAPEISTPTGHYVDNDLCQPDCILSVVVYQESNGIDGLQRGDRVVDDTCNGAYEADTPVWLAFL